MRCLRAGLIENPSGVLSACRLVIQTLVLIRIQYGEATYLQVPPAFLSLLVDNFAIETVRFQKESQDAAICRLPQLDGIPFSIDGVS